MSVTTDLQIRDLRVCDVVHCDNPRQALNEAAPGDVVKIVAVCPETDAAMARRLFDLGFAPGRTVEVLRRAPMTDPVLFRLAGFDIALRRDQAHCIKVVPAT